MEKTVTAVVVCAGNASRMGGINKIFAKVDGIPVLARTLRACEQSRNITDIVIVTKQTDFEAVNEIKMLYGIKKQVLCANGGQTRVHSVLNGVGMASGDYVAIMDGARPLVDPFHIDNTCAAAFECGAAALGVKMTDTVKRVSDGVITDTVDRSDLARIQTPQVFEREKYERLAKTALESGCEFTDDCSVYEHFGLPVQIVYGSDRNVKVTVKEDLEICERLVKDMRHVRAGHGYDVHKLVKDRELWLCGEKIEFELGLDGHSDADVALHALTDALLGAAAMGDIGKLFPDNDPKYKGISSIILLKTAAEKVFSKYTFVNCDVTIIAQKPKLAPHIQRMRENIANALGTDIDNVSVKATTEEKLGFTGNLQGISAHAVCSIY